MKSFKLSRIEIRALASKGSCCQSRSTIFLETLKARVLVLIKAIAMFIINSVTPRSDDLHPLLLIIAVLLFLKEDPVMWLRWWLLPG